MADPLSFVASVIAIAGLAEAVATRGYRYLKAVKNCPDEVRNLMAETNVLCGILGRLSVLVGGNRLKSEATAKSKEPASQNSDDDDDESSDEEDVTSDGNDVSKVSHRGMKNYSILSAMLRITYALPSASPSRLHLRMPENSARN